MPGKNVRLLAHEPLYLRAVRQALRTVGQVVLSTDIGSIDAATLPQGCELLRRTRDLASDTTPMDQVIDHAIRCQGLSETCIVLLQATSPLRRDDDVQKAIELYNSSSHDLVMSVVLRDSSVLKYGLLNGTEFTAVRNPAYCFQNRQQLPKAYGPNGAIYVFSAADFLKAGGFPRGSIGAIEMPADRSLDIDTIEDFALAERMLTAAEST